MFIVKLIKESLGNFFTLHIGPEIPSVEHNSSGTHDEPKREGKRKKETCRAEPAGEEKT